MKNKFNALFKMCLAWMVIFIFAIVVLWVISAGGSAAGIPGMEIISFAGMGTLALIFLVMLYRWAKKYKVI